MRNVPKEDIERIRDVFLNLERTKGGRAILRKLGFAEYLKPDEKQTVELTKWLGSPAPSQPPPDVDDSRGGPALRPGAGREAVCLEGFGTTPQREGADLR